MLGQQLSLESNNLIFPNNLNFGFIYSEIESDFCFNEEKKIAKVLFPQLLKTPEDHRAKSKTQVSIWTK
ncbi:MAG: hypothetical protein CK425_10955 [Parachlamydia sp.]|nr:MAG: hypothetical protein CK425_10955 [Parachlamydia sp.]